MKRIVILTFVLMYILIELVGCSIVVNQIRTRKGRKRYTKDKFLLYEPNFKLSDTSIIKTNGIFVFECNQVHNIDGSRKKGYYRFWRFFEGGQIVMYGCSEGIPSDSILDNSKGYGKYAHYGYYRFRNDTLLIEWDNNFSLHRRVILEKGYLTREIHILTEDYIKFEYYIVVAPRVFPFEDFRYDTVRSPHVSVQSYKYYPMNLKSQPNW